MYITNGLVVLSLFQVYYITHRIHGDPINMSPMLAYIPSMDPMGILKYGHVMTCAVPYYWAPGQIWAAWVWNAKESQDGSGGASQAVSWLRKTPKNVMKGLDGIGVDSWLSRLWSPHSDQHDQPRYLQASLFRRYLNYSIWAYLGVFLCDMMWHACLPALRFAVNDWSQSAVWRGSQVVKLRIFELLQRLHSEGFASKDNSKEGMHQKWAQTSEKKKHKEQLIISYVSTNHGPPLTCFLGGLV